MKTYLISLSFLALLLVGCTEKQHQINFESTQLTTQSDDWEVDVSYPSFSSEDAISNQSCELLNGEIQLVITNLQDSIKKGASDFFTSLPPEFERPLWKYSLTVADSVFMATDKYISVRLTAYIFTGGAHGMTRYYTFNYDVKNQRLLEPNEIVNFNDRDAINQLLKANLRNPEKCFDTDPTIQQVSVINFNSTDVCFTYEHYILGAYACGSPEITIKKEDLKENSLLHN